MHETFCRSVQTQLSGVVRTPVGIEVVSADQVTYREFLNSIPTPSLLSIVTMEPFEGNAVMELNLPLALSIVDRLVGGPGTQRAKARELTEIEQALLANVTDILLGRVHRGLVDRRAGPLPPGGHRDGPPVRRGRDARRRWSC